MKRSIVTVLTMAAVMTVCAASAQDGVVNTVDKDTVSVQRDNGIPADKFANADTAVNTPTDADTVSISRGNDASADTSAAADTASLSSGVNTDTVSIARDNNVSVDTSDVTDTTLLSSGINPNAKPDIRQDTVPRLSGTFWGFGFGLAIGNIPLFTMWQNALPSTIEDLGLSPAFGADWPNDTLPLRYNVIESPEQFNFALPLSVSIYNIKKNSITAFSLSYFQNSKQFQSIISCGHDTLNRRVNTHDILKYYSLTVEASYHAAVPFALFSIDGAHQSFLSMSIGVSPLNYFTREGDAKTNSLNDDQRMQAAADSAKNRLAALSANGMALAWRVGINTLRGYANGGGIEMGLFYSGSYSAYFYGNGEEITKNRIRAGDGGVDKPLSFLSNRVEFKVSFMRSAKREDKKDNAK